MERAIRLEDFRMPDADGRSARAAHAKSTEPGNVLAAIEQDPSTAAVRPHHGQSRDRPDGRRRPRLDRRPVDGDDGDGKPLMVVESRLVPVILSSAQVDARSVVEVRRDDLRRRRAPRPIGLDDHPGAVDHVDLELSQQCHLVAVGPSIPVRIPAEATAEPSVAEHRSDRIRALADQGRHVESVGEEPAPVRRPARPKEIRGDRAPVDRHKIEPERGHVEPRPRHCPWHRELASHDRARSWTNRARVVGERHRVCRPVGWVEQPGLDRQTLTPARPARMRPDPDAQPGGLTASQRRTRNGDVHLVRGLAAR